MKDAKYLLAAICIMIVFFATSCSKSTVSNTIPTPTTINLEHLLDSGKWVLSKIWLYGAGADAPNVATEGSFSFVNSPLTQFRMDGFTFTNLAENGTGTMSIDGYSAGGTYYFQQHGETLVIYFNNMNGQGFGGTISVSSTQLIIDMNNNPLIYTQGNSSWNCAGFKELLTH